MTGLVAGHLDGMLKSTAMLGNGIEAEWHAVIWLAWVVR